MCDLLNDNSKLLFGHGSSSGETVAAPADGLAPPRNRSFLELGSGIGRAGILAAKLMSLYHPAPFDSCVLTDGKLTADWVNLGLSPL
jgi:hypothetical protein